MKTRVALSLVWIVCLLAAACSGSDSATESTESPTDTTETTEATEAPASSESTTGEPKTLDEYLGRAAGLLRGGGGGAGGGGGGGVDADQLIEEQRLIQQAIQVCMQAQGFTYVPQEAGGGLRFFLATEGDGSSPRDYAETEGFGISTRFDALFDADFEADDESSPNQDHLATLSEGEADAWRIALNGVPPERNAQGQIIDRETGEVIAGGLGRANGGCTEDAQVSVRGDLSVIADLSDEFDALQERIDADPRLAEISAEWADCMRTAGFTFENEAEARDEINAEMRPLLRSLLQAGAGGNGAGGDGQGRQGGGNRLQALAGIQLTPEQEAELSVLQDRERAIAIASFDCQGDTAQEIESITLGYEAEFVEANRTVLESIQG